MKKRERIYHPSVAPRAVPCNYLIFSDLLKIVCEIFADNFSFLFDYQCLPGHGRIPVVSLLLGLDGNFAHQVGAGGCVGRQFEFELADHLFPVLEIFIGHRVPCVSFGEFEGFLVHVSGQP